MRRALLLVLEAEKAALSKKDGLSTLGRKLAVLISSQYVLDVSALRRCSTSSSPRHPLPAKVQCRRVAFCAHGGLQQSDCASPRAASRDLVFNPHFRVSTEAEALPQGAEALPNCGKVGHYLQMNGEPGLPWSFIPG